MRTIALVVGSSASKLGQQLRLLGRQLAESASRSDLSSLLLLGDLSVDVLQVVLAVDVGLRQTRIQFEGCVSDLKLTVLRHQNVVNSQCHKQRKL